MTVVLAAHGSPDPRHAAAIGRIRDAVALHLEDVRVGWLGHHSPSLTEAVAAAPDVDSTVVVPLLLAPAFHARIDVPAGAHGLPIARVLAPDALLLEALDARTAAALDGPTRRVLPDALVLAAAGSTDPGADQLVRSVAADWFARNGLPVAVAYTSSEPGVGAAVDALRRRGAQHVAVGSFFLAPGRLHDAVRTAASDAGVECVGEPLGDHPGVVQLVVRRARDALGPVPG